MNQANTLCLVAVLLIVSMLARTFCFGLNPMMLGGWGPAMILIAGPLVTYLLGRIYQ